MPNPTIVSRRLVDAATRADMFALHARCFAGVRRERFDEDLEEKDWVILLRDATGRIVGFSTQKVLAGVPGAVGAKYLFSGDTIVAREHWNTPYLAGCFGHVMLRLIRENPRTPLFWFLISKGFRTYRFLPVFFNRFWPGPGTDTPPDVLVRLHAVAGWKFGARFDPVVGLVKDPAGDRLSSDLAEIPESRRGDPFTRFFLEANPRYDRGDELACLAPISEDNLNALARRVIARTCPQWIE